MKKMNRFDYYVDRIIKELGITDYFDLFKIKEIAYARNAIVLEDTLVNCEARIIIGPRKSTISVRKNTSESRKRFSIAHELGHLELHKSIANTFSCNTRSIDNWNSIEIISKYEIEANEFASRLLLPKNFIEDDCDYDPSTKVIIDLAEKYHTSLTAAGRRYVEFSPCPTAIVWSEEKYIKWFFANEELLELGYFIDVKGKVSPGTTAWKYYENGNQITKPQKTRSEDWMKSGEGNDIEVMEQSIFMPNLNGIITLIWIEPSDYFDY